MGLGYNRKPRLMIDATITETPEIRFTASGKTLAVMSLSSPRLSTEGPVYAVAWEEQAEIIANDDDYFSPGAKIRVEGYFKDRTWKNADGKECRRREFVIREIYP